MRQISRYFELPMRIIFALFLICWSGFIIKNFVYEAIIFGAYEIVVVPSLLLVVGVIGGSYFIKNQCHVSVDNQYLYAENLFIKEKIPLGNIETYYVDFKGFNIIFKEKTKFGSKIFFYHDYFEKKQTIKILNKIIQENRQDVNN